MYFVDQPAFYDRAELYQRDGVDHPDNAERFLFFSKAAAELALRLKLNALIKPYPAMAIGAFEVTPLTMALGISVALAVGVLLGAQLGAYFSKRVRSAWIIRSLAVALGLVGIRILITSLKPLGL